MNEHKNLIAGSLRERRLFILLIILLFAVFSPFFAFSEGTEGRNVNVGFSTDLAKIFEGNESLAHFGSGLAFRRVNMRGAREFYTVNKNVYSADKPFRPVVGVITYGKDGAQLKRILSVHSGKAERGIFDSSITSVFPEGIAVSRNDVLWIADAGIPSLFSVHSTRGGIVDWLRPGEGLPDLLEHIQKEKGFASVSVTPQGFIVSALKSVLDISGETADTAQFIRIYRISPDFSSIETFAYPIEKDLYVSTAEVTLTGMQTVNEHEFMVVESGVSKEGKRTGRLYMISLESAADISSITDGGKPLEYISDSEVLFGEGGKLRKPVKKTFIETLLPAVEGISLIDDGRTVAGISASEKMDISERETGLIISTVALSGALFYWSWREYSLILVIAMICLFFAALFYGSLRSSGSEKSKAVCC